MTQKPRNADYTREYNRKAVLRILRRQAMSRAELARSTGLTRAAASLIVEELLNAGVVTELAPQSAGRGRSATPLALRPDSYYALAVDLARKGCTVGLCDIGGNLLQCRELPEQSDMTDAIAGALASLLESVDRRKVLGIGISAPGPLDCENGRILNPPRFERWHGMDIGKRLSDALGLPSYLEHDVCAMALHQRSTGQSRNFMLLFIDIGIGAAIVSGSGAGQPNGILPGINWTADNTVTTKALTADNLLAAVAKLPAGYAGGAKFAMSTATLFGQVYPLKNLDGDYLFTDTEKGGVRRLFGFEIVLDDNIPAGTVLFGNFHCYGVNIPAGVAVEMSRDSGFTSGLIDYRALCIADGKPIVPGAFVKLEVSAA